MLGARWWRRIERVTGEKIVAASANGTYWHAFTTADHRHGEIHARPPYEVEWKSGPFWHFSSCREIFGKGGEL